ncbi:MAG: T9SS type A sorting domain-containing protein [Bacteroidia bacterium]|nr:T9SS type A sorting domain-containing protein [Bacteroidia bacterium]
MTKKLYTALLFVAFTFANQLIAGKFYWVNNGGTWDYQSPFNWASSSGGAAGTKVPGQNDTAYFDANSFTKSGETVTIFGSTPVKIHTIDFTGVQNYPTVSMGANDNLEIYGSLILDPNISPKLNGNVFFQSTSLGNIIDTKGNGTDWNVIFNGNGGQWRLKSPFSTSQNILILFGKFITNGFDVSCTNFLGKGTKIDFTVAKGSTITVIDSLSFADSPTVVNMAQGSRIVINSFITPGTFIGGGNTYANVDFNGAGATITGSNTFDTLAVFGGATISINKPGDTQNFNALQSNVTSTNYPVTINGSALSVTQLYDLNGGINCLNYTDISNVNAKGAAGTVYSDFAGTLTGTTGVTTTTALSLFYDPYKQASCATGSGDGGIALVGSGGQAPYTYSWDPSKATGDTLKIASGGITYTVNMEDVCHAQYTTTVMATASTIDIPSPYISPDSIMCTPHTVNLSSYGGGANTYSWSPGATLSSTTSSFTVASPTVTTTYTLTMTNATCVKSLTVSVIIENPKAIISTDSITVCLGEQFSIDGSASSGSNVLAWWSSPGDCSIISGSDSLHPFFNSSATCPTGWYYLQLADVNSTCESKDSIYVNVLDSIIKIKGRVTHDNGTAAIDVGYVLLYKDNNSGKGKWPVCDSVQLTANGVYTFDSTKIHPGKYIIRVFPDATKFPRIKPMYYKNPLFKNDTCTYYWDSATVITVYCADDISKNIDLDQMPDLNTLFGKGVMNGFVKEGPGYVPYRKYGGDNTMTVGKGVKGVGVGLGKQPNPAGNIIATTVTDSAGFYKFNTVPPGQYTIFADVPGLPMDSTYSVIITGVDSVPNLDYYVNDSIVYITTISSAHTIYNALGETILTAFPNPYSGAVTISIKLSERSAVLMNVYNLLGEKVATLENNTLTEGEHKYSFGAQSSGLAAGMYIVKLNVNDKSYSLRIAEMK